MENVNPLISVIIPVYNVEKYLRQCLDSIINQTLKNIEIICVDDGSTDSSLSILQEYQKKDKRFIILQQQNQYAGVARNTGMKIAKGRYLSFLDSDDFFQPNMLEDMYKKAEADNSDIVICGWYSYNNAIHAVTKMYTLNPTLVKASPFSGKQIAANLFTFCKPNAWTKLFRRSFFEANNLYFEPCKIYNDMTCVCLAMAIAKRISCLNKCYVYYRNAQKSNLTAQYDMNYEGVLYAISRLDKRLKEFNVFEVFKQAFIKKMSKRINSRYIHTPDEYKSKFREKAYELLPIYLFSRLNRYISSCAKEQPKTLCNKPDNFF